MRRGKKSFLSAEMCGLLEARTLLSALLNIRMVVDGGAFDGANSLAVSANQVVNFRIVGRLAPVGTVNNTKGQKITSLSKSPIDGIAQVRFNIQESATDQIKADFTQPVTLLNGFDAPTFSTTGIAATRAATALHDLDGVKAVQPFGTFVGVISTNTPADIVLAKGSFTVKSLGTGGTSTVFLSDSNPTQVPGAFKINGGVGILPETTDSDPILAFGSLKLTASGVVSTKSSISGSVFNDANKNGMLDAGDSLLSARKMYIDANKNGKLDSGEATATSNAGGVYTFSNLSPGTYRIRRADLPAGYSYTEPASGFYDVTVASGQAVTGKDFGAILGTAGGGGSTGSISGSVFNDGNKNGKLDAGDTLLSARKIYIDANKNGKLDTGEKTATSNASGVYTFTGLAAGTYELRRADTPAGYTISDPASGFYDVTISAGQVVTGKDFGAFLGSGNGGGGGGGGVGSTASISGTVFNDTNDNGKLDAGESLLSARKIYIDANKNGKLDSGEKTATSNASGVYTFAGLAAGSYEIRRADTPAGYRITDPASGFYDITVVAGQVVTGKDFGAFL